ncbi:putative odorant receptor 85e [Fopius arisanus]|uniref:Odorant receptor 85e n=1 Tax=Fopius arisanus TaxID=64838 RepID=A0A9R1UAF9_9HYME|nr:PREDICTED: putative odorant receptor 85e [Fopius arisanus]
MFEILKFHLETLSMECPQNQEEAVTNSKIIMEKFRRFSDLQTQILKFVKNLEASYNIALLVIVGVNILTIVLTGITAIIKKSQPSEMIRMVFTSAGGVCHLFWISWLGHALEVQSEKIFIAAYQGRWYYLPHQMQLMLLPIMMRSLIPCHLTAGKFYIMCMESFGRAVKMMMSSFMVLISLR